MLILVHRNGVTVSHTQMSLPRFAVAIIFTYLILRLLMSRTITWMTWLMTYRIRLGQPLFLRVTKFTKYQICCHQMCSFELKMHQNRRSLRPSSRMGGGNPAHSPPPPRLWRLDIGAFGVSLLAPNTNPWLRHWVRVGKGRQSTRICCKINDAHCNDNRS